MRPMGRCEPCAEPNRRAVMSLTLASIVTVASDDRDDQDRLYDIGWGNNLLTILLSIY